MEVHGVNLKALAVPPFLVEITVGPWSLSFALLHACRYDPVIWSSSETLSGRLCEPEEAEEGTGISAKPARRDLIRSWLDLSQSIRSPIKTTLFRKQLVSFLFIRTLVRYVDDSPNPLLSLQILEIVSGYFQANSIDGAHIWY